MGLPLVCAFHDKDALIGSQALKGTKTIGAPSVGQNYIRKRMRLVLPIGASLD